MRETDTQSMAENADTTEDMAYGCVFCLTGKERQAAEQIEAACPGVRAVAMRQMKYRTRGGIKTREEAVVLPSYVFFRAPAAMQPIARFPRQNLIRVLMTDDNQWQLTGEDRRFVKWLFQYDGLLGFSQAYKEGDRIRIVSGPLKDMEGKLARVDKRGCSGQVILFFNGKEIPVWLGFELISPL